MARKRGKKVGKRAPAKKNEIPFDEPPVIQEGPSMLAPSDQQVDTIEDFGQAIEALEFYSLNGFGGIWCAGEFTLMIGKRPNHKPVREEGIDQKTAGAMSKPPFFHKMKLTKMRSDGNTITFRVDELR